MQTVYSNPDKFLIENGFKFEPQAGAHISNTGGIEIMLNNSCDGLYYRINYGQDLSKAAIIEAEIETSQDEENEEETISFFMQGQIKWNLNEFIKF